ncbi:hypothetical protein E1287_08335 [Actinomadura sp. KC06]|nr:hypothetical protein E1287_08335 [Actinomadura sp. KC06]
MSLDAWRRLGRQIFLISDSSGWWLGDWLIYGQDQFPDRYRRALAETSLDYQTLRNYAWVARQFAPERRRDGLSFQHHAEVAGLPEPDQDIWLSRAERHGWSRNALRRHLQASRELGRATVEVTNIQVHVVAQRRDHWQRAADKKQQELVAWMVAILDEAAASTLEAAP